MGEANRPKLKALGPPPPSAATMQHTPGSCIPEWPAPSLLGAHSNAREVLESILRRHRWLSVSSALLQEYTYSDPLLSQFKRKGARTTHMK